MKKLVPMPEEMFDEMSKELPKMRDVPQRYIDALNRTYEAMENGAEFPSLDEAMYRAAMQRIEKLWDAPEGSAEAAELSTLIDACVEYEKATWGYHFWD